MHLGRKGQAQILTVIIMGNVMLAMILGVMEFSNRVKIQTIKESKVTEMRKALDASHRMLLQIYREGVCDPVALNNKINLLDTSGQLSSTIGQRQVNFTINGKTYLVSIGPVTRIGWVKYSDPSFPAAGYEQGEDRIGVSQDAAVEVWTYFGGTRVTQRASLINDCTYPCAYEYGGILNSKMGMCAMATDPIIGYHMLDPTNNPLYAIEAVSGPGSGTTTNPAVGSYPQTYKVDDHLAIEKRGKFWPGNFSATLATYTGGVSTCPTSENDEPKQVTGVPPTPTNLQASFTGNPRIDVRDLAVFRDYLRSGNMDATCIERMADNDLNQDGIVNENDLVMLEKFLRGYVYQIPVVDSGAFTTY